MGGKEEESTHDRGREEDSVYILPGLFLFLKKEKGEHR